MELLKRLPLVLCSIESWIVILVAIDSNGCAGTTTIERQHHLLQKDSSTASVCFLRPKEGLGGGWAEPIGIKLDGEKLLDLSVDQYTFLDIKPGTYELVVTNWTDGPKNSADAIGIPPPRVQTTRNYVLRFDGADSLYLLFSLEKIDFWNTLLKDIANRVEPITIDVAKNVTLQFSSSGKPETGRGYSIELVSKKAAQEIGASLEFVEGRGHSSFNK